MVESGDPRPRFQRAPPPTGRRWLIASAVALAVLLALVGLGYLWALRAARNVVLQAVNDLGSRLEGGAHVDRVDVGLGGVSVEGLRVQSAEGLVLGVRRAEIRFDPVAVLWRHERPDLLLLAGVRVDVPWPLPPDGPARRLLRRVLPDSGDSAPVEGSGGSPATRTLRLPRELVLRDAALTIRRDGEGQPLRVAVQEARAALAEGHALPAALIATAGALAQDLVTVKGRVGAFVAEGRVLDGPADMPRTAWKVGGYATPDAAEWAVFLRFAERVPIPRALTAGITALQALSVGGLRANSTGEIAVEDAWALLTPARAAHLGEVAVEVDRIAVRGDEVALDPRALDTGTLLSGLRRLRLVGVHAVAGQVRGHFDLREGTVELIAPTTPDGTPGLRSVSLVGPALALAWTPREAIGRLRRRLRPPPPVPDESPATAPSLAERLRLPPGLATLEAAWPGADLTVGSGSLELGEGTEDRLRVDGLALRVLPRGADGAREFEVALRAASDAPLPGSMRVTGHYQPGAWPIPSTVRLEGAWLALVRGLFPEEIELAPTSGGEVNIDLEVAPDLTELKAAGAFALEGLGFHIPEIARIPVEHVAAQGRFSITWSQAADRLTAAVDDITLGYSHGSVRLNLTRLGETPVVDLRVRYPEQPCDNLLQDIPTALVPRLEGAELAGNIEFDIRANVDMADPYTLKLDINGDWSGCRARSLGSHIDIERLNQPFVHHIWEKGERTDITVGPGTDEYVPLDYVPSYVWQAALATEDMAFFRHQGFRVTLLTRAIRLNLSRERYAYGGSTISQQLVKNLFLSREKTLSRKLEEAIITWHMERVVTKERILELYLNCIEYGPGLYGIRRASYLYFGKHPSALSPLEASFLMALKPAPKSGYTVYKRRRMRRWWREKLERVMKRLWREMDVLTQDQYEAAKPFVPAFHYPGEGWVYPKADVPVAPPSPPDPTEPPRSEDDHRGRNH